MNIMKRGRCDAHELKKVCVSECTLNAHDPYNE